VEDLSKIGGICIGAITFFELVKMIIQALVSKFFQDSENIETQVYNNTKDIAVLKQMSKSIDNLERTIKETTDKNTETMKNVTDKFGEILQSINDFTKSSDLKNLIKVTAQDVDEKTSIQIMDKVKHYIDACFREHIKGYHSEIAK